MFFDFIDYVYILDKSPIQIGKIENNIVTCILSRHNYEIGDKIYFGNMYNGVTIALAGITGYKCYLNNYNFKIEGTFDNFAQASYVSYHKISGNLDIKTNPNTASSDSIAHSTTTNIISGKILNNSDVYNFTYTFAINLNPIYSLGSEEPIEVKPIRDKETVNMTENLFTGLVYTGQNVPINIKISGLLDTNSFEIQMPDAYVNNSTIESTLDDIVRTSKTLLQYY